MAQVARHEGRELFAFTRPGDTAAQDFARAWVRPGPATPTRHRPTELDAAMIFAPVGSLVPAALAAVRKGGTVVCGGIHMSDIPSFPYRLLWEERVVRSVANLTRQDAVEFLALARRRCRSGPRSRPIRWPEANQALADLRAGRLQGRGGADPLVGRASPADCWSADPVVARYGRYPLASQRVERRLAAILAADIVGYSRLIERGRGRHAGRDQGACASRRSTRCSPSTRAASSS